VTDSIAGLYTANEKWFNINIDDLGNKMRFVYISREHWHAPECKSDIKNHIFEHCNRNKIGNNIKNFFNNI